MKEEITLLRNTLNLIDISDVKDEEQSENDRLRYCNQIFQVWEVIEKDIKKMLWDQIIKNNESENYDRLNYGRGVCEGFSLLFEKWQTAAKEYENSLKKESIDKTNILPEL